MASPFHHCIWLTAQLETRPPHSPTNRFPRKLNQMGIQREVKAQQICTGLFFCFFEISIRSNLSILATGNVSFSWQPREIFHTTSGIWNENKSQLNNLWEKGNKTNRGFKMNLWNINLVMDSKFTLTLGHICFLFESRRWRKIKNR